MSHPVKLLIPKDVLEVVDSVCPKRGRTRFIVAAIRAKLAGEPAAQRARKERAESIKAKTGSEMTSAEAAQWRYDLGG